MNNKFSPLFIFLFLFAFLQANAQFSKPFSVGFGGGANQLYGDRKDAPIGYSGHVDLDALINPFISVGINAQTGKLYANQYAKGSTRAGIESENNYKAVNANIKVRAGQFFVQNENYSYYMLSNKSFLSYLSNAYVGVGFGFIANNHVKDFIDEKKNTELIVPLNIGIDFPMGQSLYGPTWAINLNYQFNYQNEKFNGDNIDGFRSGNYNDHYAYLSLGVKIALFNRR